MDRFVAFINGAIEELHQVRWPTRQQAVRLAAIVLAFTLVAALAFGFLDFGLSQLIHAIVSLAI